MKDTGCLRPLVSHFSLLRPVFQALRTLSGRSPDNSNLENPSRLGADCSSPSSATSACPEATRPNKSRPIFGTGTFVGNVQEIPQTMRNAHDTHLWHITAKAAAISVDKNVYYHHVESFANLPPVSVADCRSAMTWTVSERKMIAIMNASIWNLLPSWPRQSGHPSPSHHIPTLRMHRIMFETSLSVALSSNTVPRR